MKLTYLAAALAAVTTLAQAQTPAAAQPAQTRPAAQTGAAAPAQAAAPALPPIDKTKLSYALGFKLGSDMRGVQQVGVQMDVNTVIRGLQDAYGDKQPAYNKDELIAQLGAFNEKLNSEAEKEFKKVADDNKRKSDQFMAQNKGKKGIVALPSGVQYRVIEEGNGARPTATSEVTVHYRGSLVSGLEFDSSFARGVPAKFKIDQVLEGWRDVLPLMRVGDHWQVFLPPEKAYGDRAPRAIGPNQALQFDIKLIEVK
jgi:FKBP-type peptidyl-prolyl cis-trans isomerase FklB